MFVSPFFVVLMFQSFVWTPSQEPQKLERQLQSNVEEYAVSAPSFLHALLEISSRFQIPMGIEWIKSPTTLENVTMSWRNTSIHQVIDSLVQTKSEYHVEIKNGVLHIFPEHLKDTHNFLNMRIDRFQSRGEFAEVLNRRLANRVRLVISPPVARSREGGEAGSMSIDPGDHPVSFDLEDVAVRDVLDRFSIASIYKIWVVTYPEKPTLTPTGFRRTVSLSGRDPVSYNYQPVWMLLKWGDKPSP